MYKMDNAEDSQAEDFNSEEFLEQVEEDSQENQTNDNDLYTIVHIGTKKLFKPEEEVILVKLYKKYLSQFQSHRIRNSIIWEKVCKELNKIAKSEHLPNQCEHKFLYLRKLFHKANRGESDISSFRFFKEFQEFEQARQKEPKPEVNTDSEDPDASSAVKRLVFRREDIEALISLYKKYQIQFEDTSIMTNDVWEMVANEMKDVRMEVTATQCKNKFSYLKKIYLKIRRGADPALMNFRYLKDFEEIFGKVVTSFTNIGNNIPVWLDDSLSLSSHDDNQAEAAENFEWNTEEEEKLIELFEQFYTTLPSEKPNMVWRYISKWLSEEKSNVSPTECLRKWNGLVMDFKKKAPTNNVRNKRFFSMNKALAAYNATKRPDAAVDPQPLKRKLMTEREKKLKVMRMSFQQSMKRKEREIEQVLVANNFIDDPSIAEDMELNDDDVEVVKQDVSPIRKKIILKCPTPSPPPPESPIIQEQEEIHWPTTAGTSLTTNTVSNDVDIQQQILDFLKEKESAKQQRHDEYMKIQREKIKLMEKIFQKM